MRRRSQYIRIPGRPWCNPLEEIEVDGVRYLHANDVTAVLRTLASIEPPGPRSRLERLAELFAVPGTEESDL